MVALLVVLFLVNGAPLSAVEGEEKSDVVNNNIRTGNVTMNKWAKPSEYSYCACSADPEGCTFEVCDDFCANTEKACAHCCDAMEKECTGCVDIFFGLFDTFFKK